MHIWYIFALLSAIFWGIEQFLYKYSAQKKLQSSSITIIYGVTSCVLSLIIFLIFQKHFTNFNLVLMFAGANAIAVFIGFITRLSAVSSVAGSIFFPIHKTGILLGMALLSFVFLHESLSTVQITGFVVAVVSIILLTMEKSDHQIKKKVNVAGITLTAVSSLAFTIANMISSFASKHMSPYEFLCVVYFFIFILSLIYRGIINKEKISVRQIQKNEFMTGMAISFFNVLGFIFFFLAFQTGIFSLVGVLNNFSLIITIALLLIVLKEKATMTRIVGILLAFISLFLLR